jgi:hypothetical protein
LRYSSRSRRRKKELRARTARPHATEMSLLMSNVGGLRRLAVTTGFSITQAAPGRNEGPSATKVIRAQEFSSEKSARIRRCPGTPPGWAGWPGWAPGSHLVEPDLKAQRRTGGRRTDTFPRNRPGPRRTSRTPPGTTIAQHPLICGPIAGAKALSRRKRILPTVPAARPIGLK